MIMGAGIFFLPAPGPGFLILLIGAMLIAEESFMAARFLDWADLRIRRWIAWSLGVWHRASLPAKLLLALGAVAILAAIVLGAFSLLFLL
ncbi:MAG: hypothetical protein IPK63_06775 [Candidatus Competibacteraceae bacterium]|nr:hypothetical protein [Candidatus Competibacteraceae bacterium]